VLIQRFGDREETVRLEVWSTYRIFLSQTRVYGGTLQSSPGKRKRDTDGMEVEENAQSLLKGQVPTLAKALLAQMKSPKANPSTLQAGYELLSALLLVLPGSLASHTELIASITKNVLSQSPTTTNSSLHLACLPFLRAFFATHSYSAFATTVPVLTPVLLRSLREKHPRISAETFGVFSALLASAKPVKGGDWAEAVYTETLARLSKSDTDAEVRVAAEEITGDLWVNAPDVVRGKGGKEWEAVCRTTGQVETAVRVVTRVAKEGDVSEQWLGSMIEWIVTLLRKGGKAGKVEAFVCLEAIISRFTGSIPMISSKADLITTRYSAMPASLPAELVPQIKPFITLQDTSLLSQALSVPVALLRRQPATAFPVVEKDLLGDLYPLAISQLVTGPALDAILAFFAALIEADPEIATRVIPNLTGAYERAGKGEASPGNVARCLAQVVKSYSGVAAATISQFAKQVKVGLPAVTE
jgi:cullin-associated NEDD8-dissociated protein 1